MDCVNQGRFTCTILTKQNCYTRCKFHIIIIKATEILYMEFLEIHKSEVLLLIPYIYIHSERFAAVFQCSQILLQFFAMGKTKAIAEDNDVLR